MCRKMIVTGFMLLIILNGLCAAENERPATRRLGIFIGSNNGGRDRVMLRYAVSDARSVSRVFASMGGIADDDNILLVEPTVREINSQLDNLGRISAQSRRNAQRTELVFYYSGHSDENGIFLNRERYSYRELRERINTVQADMKIVILDSCYSGAITRAKGGEKTQPFLFDTSVSAEGFAILTSSSDDEASQESDSIESSYFTHSLLAGLRGAADSVGDGRVTLNELYRYAYVETLARTETSVYGTQHPSYDIQISGSGDVVLTDIKEISASLLFSGDITGRISIRDNSEFLVAELTKVTNRPLELGLEPGTYRITLQQGNNFYRVEITFSENQRTVLGMGHFQQIASASGNRNRGDDTENASFDEDVDSNEGSPSSEGGSVYPFNLQIIPGFNNFNNFGHNDKTTNNVLIGLFGGVSRNIRGVGLASLFLINTGYVEGAQVSGIFNIAEGDVRGVQVSGIFNYAEGDFQGVQLGSVNINRDGKGVMVGVVNISQSEDGILPIGVVNIIKNGILHPAIYIDDMLFTNISFRSGSKHFYTTLSIGMTTHSIPRLGRVLGDIINPAITVNSDDYDFGDKDKFVYRSGFGYEIPIRRAFIDIDATSGTIVNPSQIDKIINQIRLTAGFKIFKHLGIFAGISYDTLCDWKKGDSWNMIAFPFSVGNIFGGDFDFSRYTHKLGFFGGIQF